MYVFQICVRCTNIVLSPWILPYQLIFQPSPPHSICPSFLHPVIRTFMQSFWLPWSYSSLPCFHLLTLRRNLNGAIAGNQEHAHTYAVATVLVCKRNTLLLHELLLKYYVTGLILLLYSSSISKTSGNLHFRCNIASLFVFSQEIEEAFSEWIGRVNDSMTHAWFTHALSAVHMRSVCVTYDVQKQHRLIGLSQMEHFMCTYNGRRVHVSVKSMRPKGVPFLILAFRRVLRERHLCGRYAPSIRTFAKPALGRARNRLLPDSQSGIMSWKCRLRGRPARV